MDIDGILRHAKERGMKKKQPIKLKMYYLIACTLCEAVCSLLLLSEKLCGYAWISVQ